MRPLFAIVLSAACLATPLSSQTDQPTATAPEATLRINSRAVLVDVLVTDRDGKPVKGLTQSDFTVNEQGKPQTISFFEEHTGVPGPPREMPQLPPNVFSNFTPFPEPPAVNVLLIDSLNTHMENQQYIHKQALKFLKTAKPGTRMAVFTMGLGLHFVQGFTDDPTLLLAALNNKKNNEVQPSLPDQAQAERDANSTLVGMMSASVPAGPGGSASSASPAMIASLQNFLGENAASRDTDQALLTMQNMQRLASFLNGFPGRKNVIWFSESFPLTTQGIVDPQRSAMLANTMAMLAAARVALYPVDARGTDTPGLYQAGSNLAASNSASYQIVGVDNAPSSSGKISQPDAMGGGGPNSPGAQVGGLQQEDQARAAARYTEEQMAHDTGGKAFVGTNGLARVIDDITSSSADFYTFSYVPDNPKMDGSYRKIEIKVAGDKYNLSYRRGYPATDEAMPGSSLVTRAEEIKNLEAQNPGGVDPLLAFMDLGMPQSQQILYKVKIGPVPPKPETAAADQNAKKSPAQSYAVDFAIDLKDLNLKLDSDGLHKAVLNISLIAYDRYGNIGTRKDFLVPLNIKPDVYTVFQQTGAQLHTEIAVPKGQYWLRTGVYDRGSRKVGTMEVALDSVTTVAEK